jgi:hypothetical protein
VRQGGEYGNEHEWVEKVRVLVTPWIMNSRPRAMASKYEAPFWVSHSTNDAMYCPKGIF